jgi:hypothetical protein
LPVITGIVTIQGQGMTTTVLRRSASAPPLRILQVGPTGRVTLRKLALRDGRLVNWPGAGILNFGQVKAYGVQISGHRAASTGAIVFGVALANHGPLLRLDEGSLLTQNTVETEGVSTAGLFNEGGTTIIYRSSVVGNRNVYAGAALFNNGGTMSVTRSQVRGNTGGVAGGVISNHVLTVWGSTLADNVGRSGFYGALVASGQVQIKRSALVRNEGAVPLLAGVFLEGPGASSWIKDSTVADHTTNLLVGGGTLLLLRNVTLAHANIGLSTYAQAQVRLDNTVLGANDTACQGPVTSLGYNVFEALGACSLTRQPSDVLASAGLGTLVDSPTPGHSHVPLLSRSVAINTANSSTCGPSDQLGQTRVGVCDRGSVERTGSTAPMAVVAAEMAPLEADVDEEGSELTTAAAVPVSDEAVTSPWYGLMGAR